MTQAGIQETGGKQSVCHRVSGSHIVLTARLQIETATQVAMPRMVPVAQIPLIVSDFYLSSAEPGLIQYADSPLDVLLRSIRFHHTLQKRRRIVDMEERVPITMDSYIIQIRTGFAQ